MEGIGVGVSSREFERCVRCLSNAAIEEFESHLYWHQIISRSLFTGIIESAAWRTETSAG